MKKLLLPLWILVVIGLVALGLMLMRSRQTPSLTAMFEQDEFYSWPIEKQVAACSVIARGEWKLEDGVYKCIIAEIIKQDDGTSFAYRIGEEFPRGNQRAQANTSYGDGQVMFFVGSPPVLRFISAISNGRLAALGDVRLEVVRAKVQEQSQ